MKQTFFLPVLLIILIVCITTLLSSGRQPQSGLLRSLIKTPDTLAEEYPPVDATPPPTATPLPTPSPTPKPLTFAQKNALYGPCIILPTLMYHHVQDLEAASAQGHGNLTVDTKNFRSHMEYLKVKGYTVVPMTALIEFFDTGVSIPTKSVLLTFDDGYDNFASDAAPILDEFNFPATVFVSTGLVQNPGYLAWSSIADITRTQPVLMANHTWSHHNMATSKETIEREITLAETQLKDHGYNDPKVFAYPYGISSTYSATFLQTLGYKLAFTTVPGTTLCKQHRLILPRIRVGNAPLSSYGL